MKKSSLKNYIAFLEADAAANANARDYWMRQHELRDEELLKAKDEIAELKGRLADSGGLCTLRAKLAGETCVETRVRLREDNERLREETRARPREDKELLKAKDEIAELKRRLLEASPTHQHNHTFERDNNDTQA